MESADDILHSTSGIQAKTKIYRNLSPAVLYEHALRNEKDTKVASSGAIITMSGHKTGRSPNDKRITEGGNSEKDVWWGEVNKKMTEHVFLINHERAVDYLNTLPFIYVFDGYAGWDPQYRVKVRVYCARAYHALFMHNMLIRPTHDELENFGKPDITIFNAGQFPANRYTSGMSSTTSIALNLNIGQMVILGSEYAGEMKKGVFTFMHYLMPLRNVLSLHSSANEGEKGDVTLFFGLSGTGKTTLSADPRRYLIGDDEHCWSPNGIFNIEGGCYAKCINLDPKQEPDIYNAIRFGAVLENVVSNPETHQVDFNDCSITENTRCAYPIDFIPKVKENCMGGHPKNIIMLTCDAFGVLPPVSKLSPEQAMYHFISGYTAKIPGTESGITVPTSTFSACFGQPFLVLHPMRYAFMLAENIRKYKSKVWLVNTGWNRGPNGIGKRISIKHSRAIIDAIHADELDNVEYTTSNIFNLSFPKSCPNVPSEILDPSKSWAKENPIPYEKAARNLADLFIKNFKKYSNNETADIEKGGPK